MERDSQDAMNDFDITIENLKEKLRSDHTFGDLSDLAIPAPKNPAA